MFLGPVGLCHIDSRLLPWHKGHDGRTCSWALWACVTWAVDCFLVIRDRIAERVLGACGPVSHGQSTACVRQTKAIQVDAQSPVTSS